MLSLEFAYCCLLFQRSVVARLRFIAGKPTVMCEALGTQAPQVSIAHSQGIVVAAAVGGDAGLGIDVERLAGPRVHDLVAGAMNETERTILEDLQGSEARRAAIFMWCAKEAAAKSAGTGLQGNPRRWSVISLDPNTGSARVQHDSSEYVVDLLSANDQVLAICRGTELNTRSQLHRRAS